MRNIQSTYTNPVEMYKQNKLKNAINGMNLTLFVTILYPQNSNLFFQNYANR